MSSFSNRWIKIGGIVVISLAVGAATSAVFFFSIFGTGKSTSLDSTAIQEFEPNSIANIDTDPNASLQNEPENERGVYKGGLADLPRSDNEFDRTLELYQHLSNLDKNQLVETLNESSHLEPDARLDVQRPIFQRLASLDSKLAFDRAKKLHPSLITTVFLQWSVTDVNEAIAHAKTLDQLRRSAALRGIFKSRDDLPENILLQIGKELNSEIEAQRLINSSKTDDYLENPGESWREVVGTVQDDPAQLGLLHSLARTWFEKEGLPVIGEINRSLTNDQARNSILDSVLHMAVRGNPQATFEYVTGIQEDTNHEVALRVIRIWGSADPVSALNAAFALEDSPVRQTFLNSVMQSWADSDPQALLSNLGSLPEEMHSKGLELAIRSIARDAPEQAASLIARMEDSSQKHRAAQMVVWNWIRSEPAAALDWVLTDAEVLPFRQDLLRSVLPSLADENPQLAFDTALAQPLEDGSPGLEVSVIARLAEQNDDLALDLLPRVRDGKTKTVAYGIVGSMLIQKGNPLEAMKMSSQLPESDQEGFFVFTMGTWAGSDPQSLFDTIDRLPSPLAQSKAAAMLSFMSRFSEESLTDSQLERVEEYLSEEDAQSVEEGEAGLIKQMMSLGLEFMP